MVTRSTLAILMLVATFFASDASARTWPGVGPVPPSRPAELDPIAPVAPDLAEVPVPAPRPSDLEQMASLPPPAEMAPPRPPVSAQAISFCAGVLASGRLEAVSVPQVIGEGGCGIETPVKLSAIILVDGTRVPLEPAALMRCELADTLATWVRDDLAPIAQKNGAKLAKIQDADAYSCRGRNRVVGAMMSEHGLGNAFDLRGVTLSDGRQLSIDKSEAAHPFMEDMKGSVCNRFRTILGPGSDGYHEDHVHLDMRERRNPKPFCQWTLK
jgi:hypothetical protein